MHKSYVHFWLPSSLHKNFFSQEALLAQHFVIQLHTFCFQVSFHFVVKSENDQPRHTFLHTKSFFTANFKFQCAKYVCKNLNIIFNVIPLTTADFLLGTFFIYEIQDILTLRSTKWLISYLPAFWKKQLLPNSIHFIDYYC